MEYPVCDILYVRILIIPHFACDSLTLTELLYSNQLHYMRSTSEKVSKKQFSDPFEFYAELTVFDVQHCVAAIVAVANGAGIKQRYAIIF